MQRHCDECGTTYEAKRPTSRFCSTRCRTRMTRKRQTGEDTAPAVPRVTAIEGAKSTRLTDATRSELAAAGLENTADGVLLLTLAERIDAVPETSPALASLSKEYAARKAEAFSGATAVVDPFDELQAARERRRAQ